MKSEIARGGNSMKAAVVTAPDATPEYADFSEPRVDDGYELVELVAAGLHPIVRSLAAGRHYGSTQSWPLVPGIDVVARTAAGDFIYTGFVRPPHGTFAERMAVPKTMRISLPPGADPVKVAGGLNPAFASWLPLKARVGEIGSLATVLVLGVTGMAGYLAVQHARLLGASRVVGVGRNPARLARVAALGAATVALSGNREVDAAAILAALGGTTPSIVLDFLWASAAETAFASLARRGLEEDTRRHCLRANRRCGRPRGSRPGGALTKPPHSHLRQRCGYRAHCRYHGRSPRLHAAYCRR